MKRDIQRGLLNIHFQSHVTDIYLQSLVTDIYFQFLRTNIYFQSLMTNIYFQTLMTDIYFQSCMANVYFFFFSEQSKNLFYNIVSWNGINPMIWIHTVLLNITEIHSGVSSHFSKQPWICGKLNITLIREELLGASFMRL